MRIVFAGTPDPAVPSLRTLLEAPEHDVVAVLTRPDAAAGRGRKVSRSPVGQVADEAGIPVLTPHSLRDDDVTTILKELAPECIPVVAYGGLVPPDLLALPIHGWVNLHFSLLPAWRGAAPVQASIAAGDDITGATTFRIDEGLDTGPTFGMVTERIRSDDTADVLLDRLSRSGAQLLLATMDGLATGRVRAGEQPIDGVSVATKISVHAARIRWDQPAAQVDRHVRAMTSHPGAWTMLGDQRIKVGPFVPAERSAGDVPMSEAATLKAGQVLITKRAVFVGTATYPVQLDGIQPPGKKMMCAVDWVRGARLPEGIVLQ